MRNFLLVALLAMLGTLSVSAHAGLCPGVSPWVFADVADNDPFCAYITEMAQRGVTLGCLVIDANNRLYCPTQSVPRTQMAAFLSRLAQGVFQQGGNSFGTTAVLGTSDNNRLEIYVNGTRAMRYEPRATSPNIVGGHSSNIANLFNDGQTIAGGGTAGKNCYEPVTGTYTRNCYNWTGGAFAAIGGGNSNQAIKDFATVAGGENNTASGTDSTIGGGYLNTASGGYSAVGGGYNNVASNYYATVPGGINNLAFGHTSLAAGYGAVAAYEGEFVWADRHQVQFEPGSALHGWAGNAQNTFNVRATGGIWLVTGVDGFDDPSSFVYVNPGSGTWSGLSDRASKEKFSSIDAKEILAKVAAIPIETWNYIAEGAQVRHMGPVSQDFWAAFALGPNDRTISYVDEGGVALAAIQGLNARLDEQAAALAERDARIARQAQEIADLRDRFASIESLRGELAELRIELARSAKRALVADVR